MTTLAPILQSFFTDKLITQRQASPHTIASYRATFRLLLTFAWQTTDTAPCDLGLHQLDADLITKFLHHLETDRGNSATTRNARLAAIHSLFRHAAFQAPEHAEVIQRVLAIPGKRTHTTLVCFLNREEIDALLAAPDQATWIGRRDHALLLLAAQTGLRVSELTNLTCSDVHLGTGAHVRCEGKGRKERCTPLTATTVAVLRDWLHEHRGAPDDPLFPSRRGGRLSPDAIEARITKYHAAAARRCPSLAAKKPSPHTLRHSAAMSLLHGGVDISVIALWLGHESLQSTQRYLHADMALKERALTRTTSPNAPPGRYQAPDPLLAYLESL
jgi:site-specific recombinase XerD